LKTDASGPALRERRASKTERRLNGWDRPLTPSALQFVFRFDSFARIVAILAAGEA
jgi:hypothetical protein